jgi:2-oxoisovalerate dehydrogenase E2 component (dihydrolipoyl transacylase)
VNISQVNAAGNRITRADVERHLIKPGLPLSAAPQQTASDREQQDSGAGKVTTIHASSTQLQAAPSSFAPGELLPLTGLRRAMAARMAAVRQVPTGCAVVEADISAVEEFYTNERSAWLQRFGFPLTYTPFFLSALAQTLRAWPAARMAWRDGRHEPRDAVHLGVAVALADGLIVPVIRDADRQDIRMLSGTQADLVARARAHRLQPDEVTGGIATLTNVGSLAGLLAFPMLNENQAVMLGVGTVTLRTIAASDGIRYRSCVYLSLTFDRRILDDLQAERFLQDIARNVTYPSWLEAHA